MKLKFRMSFILCLLFFITINGFPYSSGLDKADYLSLLEREIIHETNLARTAPKDYASFLEQFKKYYHGKLIQLPNETPISTEEGVGALLEAIRFLQSAKPVPILTLSKGMSLGAKDHVKNLWLGDSHHRGSDKSQPWDRVNRYGTWQKVIAENICCGHDRARYIVMSLIIDDGVPHRGHRKNIFNPDFHVAGVACSPHAIYGMVCVITFSGEYQEKN